jgi:hypothetical protein
MNVLSKIARAVQCLVKSYVCDIRRATGDQKSIERMYCGGHRFIRG